MNSSVALSSSTTTGAKIIPLFTGVYPTIVGSSEHKVCAKSRPINYGYKNSPLTAAGKPKAQPSAPVKTKEDIERINDYFYNTGTTEWVRLRNWMMWNLGISLGLRISDLLSLRICDIINPDGIYKDHIVVYEQKTGKRRSSYLSDKSKRIINKYINSIKDIGIDTSIKNNDFYYSFLFRSTRGEVVTKESAHRIMKQMSKDLNLPYNVGTHTLRKTFAYWTIKEHSDQGDVMAALQKLLNHSDQRVTFSYACIDDDVLENIYNDLSDILIDEIG